jgi:hypothetical protein
VLKVGSSPALPCVPPPALTFAEAQNPFYELEMPIRCSLFNAGLKTYVDKFNIDAGRRRPQGADLY